MHTVFGAVCRPPSPRSTVSLCGRIDCNRRFTLLMANLASMRTVETLQSYS
jgi:hypothetical protein